MSEPIVILLIFIGVPILIPAIFLFTHGGKMTSRGIFYVLGVLISHVMTYVAVGVLGFLCGFIGPSVGTAMGSIEQGMRLTMATVFPLHAGVVWAIMPGTGLGVLLSVAALKLLALRFRKVECGAVEATEAAEPHPGPA
ncbi:MAG: hypothetical protein IT365_14635 [Candidatus Hydrogenedentes bacterium]|nr:hypothetical protein [Candidatus Hydrogenedentota bacterium]